MCLCGGGLKVLWYGQEMAEAEASQPKKKRLPRGTSEYQAAWILDEEGDAGDFEDPMGDAEGDPGDEGASETSADGVGSGDAASVADTGGLLDGSMVRHWDIYEWYSTFADIWCML